MRFQRPGCWSGSRQKFLYPGRKLKLTRFSLQLRVLHLGLLQDGQVWLDIFPEAEEVAGDSDATFLAPEIFPGTPSQKTLTD